MKLRILLCLLSLGMCLPLNAEIFNEFLQREHPESPSAREPEPAAEEVRNPDPWERFNRKVYAFNDGFDRAFLKPTARGIKQVMPEPVNQGVHNFFGNLADVGTGINNMLQGKFRHALSDTGRVLVNTTMGVGGLFDIASRMNLEKHNEDFGQTLGKWGVGPGPYLVVPFLGPSSLRDRVGYTIDLAFDPLIYLDDEEAYLVLLSASILEERASLLEATDLLDTAALDPYAFQRDAYLQKREYDVNDGEDDDDF